MTLTELFAANVRTLMARQSPAWTQLRLSAVSGIAPPHITTMLKGSLWPSAERIQKIADAFGVQPHELLLPIPEMPPPKPSRRKK